ncbi:cytochrome c oxidase subunit II [Microcoleus sp. FACHB-1515]|uniref:cytochrome c oxidase subunit II n=1 Tax=Cyanophyceae TaxID=3028117 RepID=UPI0028C3ED96|nr:cytochrome c oxidase subunit II [Microcoleus sp. FACHB-1515]
MNIPPSILTMLAGIAITLISLWYGQNHGLLPPAVSAEAAMVDGLFNTMMTVSIGLFLLIEGALVISVIKFRRKKGDTEDGPPIHGNVPLEIVWTAIPAVIVLIIGVYSFDVYRALGGFDPEAASDPGAGSVTQVAMLPDGTASNLVTPPKHKGGHNHMMALGVGAFPQDEGRPADVNVDVTGLQYAWIFTYPESGITSGELHVPANEEVQLNIKAQDVLHAFWVPELRLKQDAIPNREAELRFKPTVPGEYSINCAELCGPYHGAMNTKLYVHTPEDYDKWVQEQVALGSESQTVAIAPSDRTEADYLAPFAGQLDIAPDAIAQLHPHQ